MLPSGTNTLAAAARRQVGRLQHALSVAGFECSRLVCWHVSLLRMQGVLNDTALLLLANELWTVLDVAGTPVTEAGLLAAVPQTPGVQTLDITGCADLRAPLYQTWAQSCI